MSRASAVTVSVLAAVFVGAVGRSFVRGDFDSIPSENIPLIIGGSILFCAVYFGAIHLLLKGWDRVWALLKSRVRQRHSPH